MKSKTSRKTERAARCTSVKRKPKGRHTRKDDTPSSADVAVSLMPWIRASLAASLRNTRIVYQGSDDLALIADRQRREAVELNKAILRNRCGCVRGATPEQQILLGACARCYGVPLDRFLGSLIEAGIYATRYNMPRHELNLTRQEIAALDYLARLEVQEEVDPNEK